MCGLFVLWLASAHAGPVLGIDVGTGLTPSAWTDRSLTLQSGAPSLAVRGGYRSPQAPALQPELSLQSTTFKISPHRDVTDPGRPMEDARLWMFRPTLGLRIQPQGLIQPGAYAHGGVGFAPGFGGGLSVDGGVLLDVALPKQRYGLHAGYEITGLSWDNAAFLTVGLHVDVPLK